MPQPVRRPATQAQKETPALHERAIQDLSYIRRTMENASSFTDVPGWGLVVIGASAVVAAYVSSFQSSAGRWISVWLAEAILAAVIGGGMMWQKMRRRAQSADAPLLSQPARKFLFGFWPAIFAGAMLTFALIDVSVVWNRGSVIPHVLPGMWLVVYGVGVTTAGAFSVRAVPLMGAGFMLLGTIALFVPAVPGTLALALGFGVWQLAIGLWIARRHGG